MPAFCPDKSVPSFDTFYSSVFDKHFCIFSAESSSQCQHIKKEAFQRCFDQWKTCWNKYVEC